jgi:hypothetical protein
MLEKKNSNTFAFTVRGTEFEVFFSDDDQVEVYETKNPGNTGFIFANVKKFIIFINMLTDVAEHVMEKDGGAKYECSESD